MHEYSIVQALLDSCEEQAKQNNATKVTKVIIKVGVMSGVEPQLLQTAFDTFKEDTMCDSAELIINIQAIVIKCHNCLEESILQNLRYYCPKCQSIEFDILDGEDMFLMSLELEI